MPQVSRPLLIALVAVVGFAGAWMTVLKKHASSTAAPPQAPGVKGLAHDVHSARAAVATANHSAGTTAGRHDAAQSPVVSRSVAKSAAPVHRAAPAKSAAPVHIAAPAKSAPPAAPAAAAGVTTVLLFAGAGADDAAARRVVRSIHGPHVRTIVASLDQVGRYAPLLGGAAVDAAPSIYVIGPQRSAQEIVGLPDRDQVETAIASVSSRG